MLNILTISTNINYTNSWNDLGDTMELRNPVKSLRYCPNFNRFILILILDTVIVYN